MFSRDLPPAWLPAIESIAGDQSEVLARLHTVFIAGFGSGELTFQGLPVWWDQQVSPGSTYESGFWHLVSREHARSDARSFEPKRAKRIAWCAAVIENSSDPAVKVWDYREGHGRDRTYLWIEEFDYVVVLESRRSRDKDGFFLVTAYYVDGAATRRALFKRYSRTRA